MATRHPQNVRRRTVVLFDGTVWKWKIDGPRGLAIEDVLRSNRLQLFVVPQTHISAGFFKADGVYDRIEIGKTVYTVAVDATHNFCEDSLLIRLKKSCFWLTATLARGSTKTTLTGLFAMTSYQALALVWEQMTTAEKTKAAYLLHLRLDESHHVSEEKNKVGKVCRFIMESKEKTNRITLSTATNFRGDNARIFTRELAAKFKNFTLDWIDHWKTIGIRDMFMEIAEFDGDSIKKIVKAVASEKNGKALHRSAATNVRLASPQAGRLRRYRRIDPETAEGLPEGSDS